MLPLYAKISKNTLLKSQPAHLGLFFDKFADSWDEGLLDDDGKLKKIDKKNKQENSNVKKNF